MDAPRLAIIHDWLTGMRGGEKCLESACRRWPNSRLYTLIHARGRVSPAIEALQPRTTFLQQIPRVERFYRNLLPLMPAAASSWRLPPCELVLSFSHCVAKGARPPRGAPHVCYCFTPMRYAWHLRDSYFGGGRLSGLKQRLVEQLLSWLREWDRATACRVTHFIAISRTIQNRIRECYGRDGFVIYPPVNTDFYFGDGSPREEFYLCVSALAPYKRLDLAIEACRRLKRKLVIIGTGQDEARLKALAGPDVACLGWQPDEVVRDHYRRCRALLFPGEEDFGIVPVEAMACGAPVIVLGRGGATETVVPPGGPASPTGLLFEEQTAEALAEAVARFESRGADFSPGSARRQAERVHARRYEEEMTGYLAEVLGAGRPQRRAA